MNCWICDKDKTASVCEQCKDVSKYELVRLVLKMDRIYIHEGNRCNGRPSITSSEDLRTSACELYKKHNSYREVAELLGISKSSVAKIIRDCKDNIL